MGAESTVAAYALAVPYCELVSRNETSNARRFRLASPD